MNWIDLALLEKCSDERNNLKLFIQNLPDKNNNDEKNTTFNLPTLSRQVIEKKWNTNSITNGIEIENGILMKLLYKIKNSSQRIMHWKLLKIIQRTLNTLLLLTNKIQKYEIEKSMSYNQIERICYCVIGIIQLSSLIQNRIKASVQQIKMLMHLGHDLTYLIIFEALIVRVNSLLIELQSPYAMIYKECRIIITHFTTPEFIQLSKTLPIALFSKTITNEQKTSTFEEKPFEHKEQSKQPKRALCKIIMKQDKKEENKQDKKPKTSIAKNKKKKSISKLLRSFNERNRKTINEQMFYQNFVLIVVNLNQYQDI